MLENKHFFIKTYCFLKKINVYYLWLILNDVMGSLWRETIKTTTFVLFRGLRIWELKKII